MKNYLAINLNDVYKNAKDGQTTARIIFVKAISIKKAELLLRRDYPANDWSLVPEGCFNKHIVLNQASGI